MNGDLPDFDEPVSRRQVALLCELLAEGFDVEVRVTGLSMAPFLRSGDLLVLTPPTPLRPLVPGDVVATVTSATVTGHERLVVHRLVETRADGLLATRGDALARPDSPVAAGDVRGVVVRIERGGRRVRLGLGPGRRLLAALSRRGLLAPLLRPWRWASRRGRRSG